MIAEHYMPDNLAYEKSQQAMADNYYRDKWLAKDIQRWDWNDSMGKSQQRRDIDVTVTTPTRIVDVSEKFRTRDWNDMAIELRSGDKLGWAITSEATGLCYFVPGKCYEINATDLKWFARTLNEECFKDIEQVQQTGQSRQVEFRMCDILLKRIPSEGEGNSSWNTVVAFVKWTDLSKFVKYKVRTI